MWSALVYYYCFILVLESDIMCYLLAWGVSVRVQCWLLACRYGLSLGLRGPSIGYLLAWGVQLLVNSWLGECQDGLSLGFGSVIMG